MKSSSLKLTMGAAVFLLMIAFIVWGLSLVFFVRSQQKQVRHHVNIITNINQLSQVLRLLRTPPAPSQAGARDLRPVRWSRLKRKAQRPLKWLLKQKDTRTLARSYQHFFHTQQDLFLTQRTSTPNKHIAQHLKNGRQAVRFARKQLRHLSITLASSWEQLTFLALLSCLMAAILAFLFTLYIHIHSKQTATETKLQDSEERFQLCSDGTIDGLWDWDIRHDKLTLSARWSSILGDEEPDKLPHSLKTWKERLHPEDKEDFEKALRKHLSGQAPFFESEHRLKRKDGSYCWVLCRGLANCKDGHPSRAAGSLSDVTGKGTYHDSLTDLPNRAHILHQLKRILARQKRQPKHSFALLFLDLDSFKELNDTQGHLAGDRFLIEISRILESCVRTADIVARLGGDEFVILLDRLQQPEDATTVASRILSALEEPIFFQEGQFQTSASIGISLVQASDKTPEDILQEADTAMYQAKRLGKGQYRFFEDSTLSGISSPHHIPFQDAKLPQ